MSSPDHFERERMPIKLSRPAANTLAKVATLAMVSGTVGYAIGRQLGHDKLSSRQNTTKPPDPRKLEPLAAKAPRLDWPGREAKPVIEVTSTVRAQREINAWKSQVTEFAVADRLADWQIPQTKANVLAVREAMNSLLDDVVGLKDCRDLLDKSINGQIEIGGHTESVIGNLRYRDHYGSRNEATPPLKKAFDTRQETGVVAKGFLARHDSSWTDTFGKTLELDGKRYLVVLEGYQPPTAHAWTKMPEPPRHGLRNCSWRLEVVGEERYASTPMKPSYE